MNVFKKILVMAFVIVICGDAFAVMLQEVADDFDKLSNREYLCDWKFLQDGTTLHLQMESEIIERKEDGSWWVIKDSLREEITEEDDVVSLNCYYRLLAFTGGAFSRSMTEDGALKIITKNGKAIVGSKIYGWRSLTDDQIEESDVEVLNILYELPRARHGWCMGLIVIPVAMFVAWSIWFLAHTRIY